MPKLTKEQFAELEPISEFAMTYLHEDWRDDHDYDLENVIDCFINENDKEEILKLVKSIETLLKIAKTDIETEELLQELDWLEFFEDYSIRTFLKDVSDVLLAESSKK